MFLDIDKNLSGDFLGGAGVSKLCLLLGRADCRVRHDFSVRNEKYMKYKNYRPSDLI